MSNEPDERDIEALAAIMRAAPVVLTPRAGEDSRTTARAVLASDWLAEQITAARQLALREAAEVVETGPMVVNGLARDASRAAFLAKWLRDRAERQRRPDYTRPHDSPGGQDEHPSTKPQHHAQPGDRPQPNPDPDGSPTDQRHRPR